MDIVISQDTLSYGCCHVTGHFPPVLLLKKIGCPLDVIMSQDALSSGCCHVTGHVVLWMLSCHRTLPLCFIMRNICCPMDVVV